MDVLKFIRLEVKNQGFDLNTYSGKIRVEWMDNAWSYARFWNDRDPSIGDLLTVGRKIEPGKNRERFRQCNVEVGGRHCPPWEEVPELIRGLWRRRHSLTPTDFYRELELVHPFVDGNGRVGKIVYCWQSYTLDNPEFPRRVFGPGAPR